MNVLLSLLTLALLWGAAALGGLAFRDLAIPESVRRLCGLGLVSLAGFAACAVGFPPRGTSGVQPLLAAAFVLAGVAGWIVVLRTGAERACAACTSRATRVSGAVLMALAAISFLYTQLPPTKIDESAYHLSIPAHALDLGHFDLIWGHIYTGFPAFAEMLFLWPLALGVESGARGVQIVVVLLVVWSSIELTPKAWSDRVVQGWILLLLVPVAFVELPCAYVDLVQLSLEVCSVLCLHRFATSTDARESGSALVAAAWLAGCAAATKYLAFPTLLAGALSAVAIALWRRRSGLALPPGMTWLRAGSGAALAVGPWLLKNAIERGNPLFPFALSLFPSSELSSLQQRVYDHQLHAVGPLDASGAPRTGWSALAHLPGEVLFGGHFTSLDLDGVIGPLALVGLLLALLPRERNRPPSNPAWFLAVYGLFKLFLWVGTSWQARFLLPALVPLCAAIPFWLAELRSHGVRALGWTALASSLAFQIHAIAVALPPLDPRAFGDSATRHALRLETQPDSALCDRAQALHPMKLMLVWSQRLSYWCPAEQVSDSIIESLTLDTWLAAGGGALAQRGLASRGITHLLIDEDRLLKLPPQRLPPAERARYDRVAAGYAELKASGLELIARGPTRALYAVRPTGAHP